MSKLIVTGELKQIEDGIKKCKTTIALNILEIGDMLIRAKEITGHGYFRTWLDENVDMSYRMANNCMRASRAFPSSNRKSISHLTGTAVMLLAELPDEQRESYVDGSDIEKMSTRELRELVKRERHNAKVKSLFATNEKEAWTEISVDVDSLKPFNKYDKYMGSSGQRQGQDYERFKEAFCKNHLNPILITKDNVVIDGMERVRVAKDLGLKTIKARYLYIKTYYPCDYDESGFLDENRICDRIFVDIKRWDFTRTSTFYIFSALYHAKIGDIEKAESDWQYYEEHGEEIDKKYDEMWKKAEKALIELATPKI